MKTRKSILFVVVVIITATLFIIPSFAVTYSIQDLSGYNIVFNNTLSYPQDNQPYYTWSIDFISRETNTILRQYNQMTLRRNTDTNAIELIYAVYANGSVVQSFLAYSSASGWYSSPIKYISISGGPSKDSPSLLSFVNYNSDTATINYEIVDDPYETIYGTIHDAQTDILGLNSSWNNFMSQNNQISNTIGFFARPYKSYFDYFGAPILICGFGITIILFIKRTHYSTFAK